MVFYDVRFSGIRLSDKQLQSYIKPANIILNSRGGLFDGVKMLHFGLPKAVDSKREMA